MTTGITIDKVVADHLCLGCGACQSVCPENAIQLKETPGGLLLAKIDEQRCSSCGLCLKVCPGWQLQKGLLKQDTDPFQGDVLAAFSGKCTDKQLLLESQSGGIVTALLCHLLTSGQIDQAVVTEMPDDGSLRPQASIVTRMEEIRHSQGSKYCPVAVDAYLKDTDKIPGNSALVGLSCHVHGLKNIQCVKQKEMGIGLTIGLVCEGVLTYGAIDYLIQQSTMPLKEVSFFRFKSKKWRGWPGDIYIRSRAGREDFLDNQHRLTCKKTFRPIRCMLCWDKMNIFSDLVAGDAWGINEGKEGASIILARSQNGLQAILGAQDAGVIEIEAVSAEAIFKGADVEGRRCNWTAYTAAWRQLGFNPPELGIESQWHASLDGIDLKSYTEDCKWALELMSKSTKKQALRAAIRHMYGRRNSVTEFSRSILNKAKQVVRTIMKKG
jgi:coenzyme F420 hydrogenase subunit beta